MHILGMRWIGLTVLTVCALGLGGSIPAAEYFVRPTGSDASDGIAKDKPLATIQKAVSLVKPGDSITLLPGTYRQSVDLGKTSGTENNPIVLRAQGQVMLTGAYELKGTDFVPAAELGPNAWKYSFQGKDGAAIHATPGFVYRREPAQMVAFLRGAVDKLLEEKLLATPGSWFYRPGREVHPAVLYLHPPEAAGLKDLALDVGVQCLIYGPYASHWRVAGIDFSGAQTAMVIGRHALVEDCRFHHCRKGWEHPFFSPVLAVGDDAQVRRCEFHDNPDAQARLTMANRVVVEECLFQGNNQAASEIQFHANGSDSRIKTCRFLSAAGIGVYPAAARGKNSRNITIESCWFEGGRAMTLPAGSYVLLENTFKNITAPVNVTENFGPVSLMVLHNLFLGCRPCFTIHGTPALLSDDNVFSPDSLVSTWQSPEIDAGSWMADSVQRSGDLETWRRGTGQDGNSVIGDSLAAVNRSTAWISRLVVSPVLARGHLALQVRGSLRSRKSMSANLAIGLTTSPANGRPARVKDCTQAVTLTADAEQQFEALLEIPRIEGEATCRLTILDNQGNRLGGRSQAVARPSAVQLQWLPPAYRATVFANQKEKRLQARISAHAEDMDWAGWEIHAVVRRPDAKDCLRLQTFAAASEAVVSVPVDQLQPGQYELVVTVCHGSNCLDGAAAGFQYLSAKPNTVRIAEDGTMLIDEKPFFPIGVHGNAGSREDLELFAQAGFNVTTGFHATQGFMDDAARLGLKIVLLSTIANGLLKDIPGPDKQKLLDEAARITGKWKDHPALLCYLWGEELVWKRELVSLYQQTRRIDPYHPMAMNGSFQDFSSLFYLADVMMNHLYAYPLYGDDRATVAAKIDRANRNCGRMIEIAAGKTQDSFPGPRLAIGNKPWWLWPQYFHGGSWARGSGYAGYGRFLSLPEMRAHVWAAIARGAKGILFWAYFHDYTNPRMNPKLWEGVRAIGGEVRSLEQVLAEPPAEGLVTADADDGLSMTVRKHGGHLYIIAAWHGAKERSIAFTLPSGDETRSLAVWSENRSVSVADRRFSDLFQPNTAHLYTTAPAPHPVMEKLLADPAFTTPLDYQPRPGNVACRQAGAKAKTSRRYTWYPLETYAIDSDPDTCWFPLYGGSLVSSPANPTGKAEWLEVELANAQPIGEVVVRSYVPRHYPDPNGALADFDLEAWDGRDWKTIATVTRNTQETVRCRVAAVTTRKIRLLARKGLYLSELEAYARPGGGDR